GGATADLLLGTESAVKSMLEPEDELGLFETLGLIGSDDGGEASDSVDAESGGASRSPRGGASLAQRSERAREQEIGLPDSRQRHWLGIAGDSALALPDDILARGTAYAPLRVRV